MQLRQLPTTVSAAARLLYHVEFNPTSCYTAEMWVKFQGSTGVAVDCHLRERVSLERMPGVCVVRQPRRTVAILAGQRSDETSLDGGHRTKSQTWGVDASGGNL